MHVRFQLFLQCSNHAKKGKNAKKRRNFLENGNNLDDIAATEKKKETLEVKKEEEGEIEDKEDSSTLTETSQTIDET